MTATRPLPPHGAADTASVRQHIRNLMAAGTGWRSIADLAGVSRTEVHRILYRNPGAVAPDTADRILTVTTDTPRPAAAKDTKVDATGTRRRVRALHHDGYDTDHIGDAIGVCPQTVHSWLRCARIDSRHAKAVKDLFERWSGVPAEDNDIDPETARNARTLARLRRWTQAGAWCDDIDDPVAAPTPWYGVRRAADLYEDSEELLAAGESIYTICRRLDVSLCNLKRARERVRARARTAARQELAA